MQPGETVQPGSEKKTDSDEVNDVQQDVPVQNTGSQPSESSEPAGTWQFVSENTAAQGAAQQQTPAVTSVSWTTSEYAAHDKSALWYATLSFLVLLVTIVIYLITRDKLSTGIVALLAITFVISAGRRPRVLEYALDSGGIQVGSRHYAYASFKSYSIISEDSIRSILLVPLKRFMPVVTIAYPPDQEDRIFTALGNYLPFEARTADPVDKLMRRIRF